MTCLLRYSHNGGQTWRVLALDLTQSEYFVDLDFLPGGKACVFQVVASAGIRTTTAQTEPFSVPCKARVADILMPPSDACRDVRMPLLLQGFGFSPDFPEFGPDEMVWRSNIVGLLGIGREVVVPALPMGHHLISLSMPNGLGGEVTKSIYIKVQY